MCVIISSETHPVVARDEDLSSLDEEEAATPPSPPKPISQEPSPVVVRQNDSSSQEPSPVVRRDKPIKRLKSAKEVELTESEEEEEEEEHTVPRSTVRDKQRDIELFWGKTGAEGAKDEDEAKPKAKAKSGGLLLEWAVPEQSATKPIKKKESPKGSPDVSEGRKERRRKSSKKGSSSKRKKEAAAGASNGTTGANDPFGVSALDAWLNSEVIGQYYGVALALWGDVCNTTRLNNTRQVQCDIPEMTIYGNGPVFFYYRVVLWSSC